MRTLDTFCRLCLSEIVDTGQYSLLESSLTVPGYRTIAPPLCGEQWGHTSDWGLAPPLYAPYLEQPLRR